MLRRIKHIIRLLRIFKRLSRLENNLEAITQAMDMLAEKAANAVDYSTRNLRVIQEVDREINEDICKLHDMADESKTKLDEHESKLNHLDNALTGMQKSYRTRPVKQLKRAK